ncbi:uncharacterized protein LOC132731737 [Ruditapes philippinarum]|uniref:uncharacterized protein LOC132731737 n=1 Tax=Ruditapes philippinarum TaxID=129788 RepID=UPI00295AFE73|nr:uncharacterized protein LOC132731737 [Ruditapes philippinarum]
MTNCISTTTFTASIAFFAVGALLFLGTAICWIHLVCKRRRKIMKAHKRPLPLTPPSMTLEVTASGAYIDLQDMSTIQYESVNATAGAKPPEMIQYIPRDAMHETFDGSRMPCTEAPQPPDHQPAIISNKHENHENVTNETGSGRDETDVTHGYVNDNQGLAEDSDVHDFESTYENAVNRDRPPTIPGRKPLNEMKKSTSA